MAMFNAEKSGVRQQLRQRRLCTAREFLEAGVLASSLRVRPVRLSKLAWTFPCPSVYLSVRSSQFSLLRFRSLSFSHIRMQMAISGETSTWNQALIDSYCLFAACKYTLMSGRQTD